MKMNKSLIVLEALLFGVDVKIDRRTYHLFQEGDSITTPFEEDGILDQKYCFAIYTFDNVGNRENKWISIDNGFSTISITNFLMMCDNISDDYIVELVADITLNKIKKSKE